ncbi:C2H2-type zinc finger transcription factor [Mucor lusitanicus]
MTDRLLWVIGQGMHVLNVHSINSLLSFAGFSTIAKIQDFKFKKFKQKALQLNPSTPQQAFLQTTLVHKFACDYEGCEYTATAIAILKKHKRIHDPNRKTLACNFPGCKYTALSYDKFKDHKKIHAPDFKTYAYDSPGCSYISMELAPLKRHKITHDPNANKKFDFDFPGWRGDSLKRHKKAKHKKSADEKTTPKDR